MFDTKTGIITGCRNEILSVYLKITCKNEINQMSDSIYICVEKNEVKNMGSRWDFDPSIAPEKYKKKDTYRRNNNTYYRR